MSADLSVSPNEVLYVEVGGAATRGNVVCNVACAPFGGFNGGASDSSFNGGGGGGGASDLRTTPRTDAGTLDSRLLVAAGGGGGGAGGFDFHNAAAGPGGSGGNAASPGDDGSGCEITGGTGGGAGGASAGGAAGSPGGAQGSQGTGGNPGSGGGAGGGGYYGGGGGGAPLLGPDPECQTGSGGGGGGSNYTTDPNATITNDANSGDGQVTISYTVPPACTQTGFFRDGINLTAKQIGGDVTGTLDATGCNIGVYYGPSTSGTVSGTISGSNYYGVVVDRAAVNVTGATIHDIGETQPNGSQHGVGVLYTTIELTNDPSNTHFSVGGHATGTLSGSSITNYQKNGVVISGTGAGVTARSNTVTGYGMINYIAQNGIEVASGATASVTGNTVSGNWYTPKAFVACGLLFIQAGGVKQSGNNLFNNEVNLCNAGRGGGNFKP